jgi:tRNA threonylcarbamoyladenosine modification (KEOPS) complex  Pcc1 subunit
MKCHAELIVNDPLIASCIPSEDLMSDRGHYTVRSSDMSTIISIEASDATALRATFNSISKLIVVYEKIQAIA